MPETPSAAPPSCKAIVFTAPGEALETRSFDLPAEPPPGGALVRVTLSTICGSDLHTIRGRRREAAPLILGHEIIGEIAALGPGLERDGFGDPLRLGDRVSWTIMACCGQCFFCTSGLPQKCLSLKKYGHTCCDESPPLTGGYAEYICLFPGTAIYRIPESLSGEIATPANCALSTVVNGVETIGLERGEAVLIQGAGLLGLNLVALAREAGARSVIVTDVNAMRLEIARRFGADLCLDLREQSPEEAIARIRTETEGERGVDVAFEVCGAPAAVPQAVEALRTGGRYLIAGLVTPGSPLDIDANQVTRKCLTIKGIHNYRPEHLGQALRFLEQHAHAYPYADLVSATFPLAEIEAAIAAAESGEHIRVAIKPES